MNPTNTRSDDVAKRAYALAGALSESDGLTMIHDVFKVNKSMARDLISRGKHLAAQSTAVASVQGDVA